MYLKRLEIQGFKSFAAKTTLDFLPPQDGRFSITGIVGPNGSGKSNITDAIRWVMGEQSMKNLRGKKSEDIIFSGSTSKGALGAVEVTMVLDNAGSETGLDFPEMIITRRLYRTGESEYIVNNSPARLLDIQLLLAKAKFAQHAYSIVSQGMIDRLLTVSASERKDFFDEASGIKEYQIKEHQASLKLARTEENIKQAETLLLEVEPRLRLLAKQVKKLEKRHEVETELHDAQEKYYFTLYTKNKQEADQLRQQLSVIEANYRTTFAELEKIQVELADLAKGATRQEVFESLQARYQEAVHAKNELERQLAIIDGQMQAQYSQAGQHNVGWLEGKVSELKVAEENLAAQVKAESVEAEHGAARVIEQKKVIDNLTIDQTQLRLKISRLQGQLFKDQSEQSYRELSGLTAVKAVLEAKNKFGKVYGLVAELGEVAEDYRLALEVAAGGHLSSIVVENESVAREAIEYLRQNRFGWATFLPLNKIESRPLYGDAGNLLGERGVVGKAIDLVKFDQKFHNIFSLVFGDTIVVENLHGAERLGIGRARMVTLEGDIVERKGIMRGGFRNRKSSLSFSSKFSLATSDHTAEIQAAVTLETHNLAELERQLEVLKGQSVDLAITAQSAKNKADFVEIEYTKVKSELARLENELRLIKSSPEEYGEQLSKLAKNKEQLLKKMGASEKEISKLGGDIEEFNAKEEEKKQRVFALQTAMQKKQEAVNQILNERSGLSIEYAKIETKQEDLAGEVLSDMRVSLESIAQRAPVVVSVEELTSLADSIQKLKYQLSLIGGIDEEVIAEHSQTKERYDFLTSQLDDLRAATNDLSKMIEELSELMKKRRAVAFKKIRKDFDRYFKILFGGGAADLEEMYGEPPSDEDDLASATTPEPLLGKEGTTLSPPARGGAAVAVGGGGSKRNKILTGIEVLANPPGKKVKYLSMLSGGERTLTSIALICAILFNNPAPFVVLDEVEAALDEANTLRFAKIINELSTHSQFIIVTHNRVTMHAASALYGVVMQGDGISKLLSVKIEEMPESSETGK